MTTKLKILFLDDQPERHEGFKKLHSYDDEDTEIHHVWTYQQAIDAMKQAQEKNEPFDVISLDHDLGDFGTEVKVDSPNFKLTYTPDWHAPGMYSSGRPKDGRDVTAWMVENKITVNMHVIIHSWNESAARSMEDALKPYMSVGRKPYRPVGR